MRTEAETRVAEERNAEHSVPVLRLRDVTKVYSGETEIVTALHGVSLEAGEGEFLAIVGRSGCGKSTLLNLAGAMDLPSSGSVVIDGQETTRLSEQELTRLRREKVGFVFQSFQLLHTLTVRENVELPLLLGRGSDARRRAIEALAWVELSGYEERLPHQLSGGQMQRVAIARALVHEPKLLLADEPTGNLDTSTSESILRLLRKLRDEKRMAILMATHSAESAAVADAVVMMKDGEIEDVIRR
ncbi:MAG: ABC transporter ATP-binding protein [Acidobacteriales bacterium]|nr:ABC transporter ATP-binding protein [Terriglobales bacterium]